MQLIAPYGFTVVTWPWTAWCKSNQMFWCKSTSTKERLQENTKGNTCLFIRKKEKVIYVRYYILESGIILSVQNRQGNNEYRQKNKKTDRKIRKPTGKLITYRQIVDRSSLTGKLNLPVGSPTEIISCRFPHTEKSAFLKYERYFPIMYPDRKIVLKPTEKLFMAAVTDKVLLLFLLMFLFIVGEIQFQSTMLKFNFNGSQSHKF